MRGLTLVMDSRVCVTDVQGMPAKLLAQHTPCGAQCTICDIVHAMGFWACLAYGVRWVRHLWRGSPLSPRACRRYVGRCNRRDTMVFWIIAGVLALGTSGLIAAALLRGRASAAPPAAYDLEIYRDQLKEVDKDLARSVITEGEADRLRAEVSRRILAADTQVKAHGSDGGQPRGAGMVLAAALVVLVTGGALAGYTLLGAPGYGDQPRAKR